jgi:peptidoglycan/LPS O-acetylase OafA/YrhL
MSSHANSTLAFKSGWFDVVFDHGHLGVYMFFVLSGYLITYLLRKEWEAHTRISLRNFYARRVLRIFPAFYGYLAVLAFLTAMGTLSIAWTQFLSAGLFAWNYKHIWDHASGAGNWFLGHLWSLSLEEQFYLLWPVTLLVVGMRRAAVVPVVLILFLPLLRVVTYFLWPEARGQLPMMVHTSADRLMFGCLLALWDGRPRLERTMQVCRHPVWAILATGFLILVSPALLRHFGGAYNLPIGQTLDGLLIAFLVAWLLRNSGCFASRLLNSQPLVCIGVLSYSLYLWQQLFLTPLNKSWTGLFPLNLFCAFGAAALSYYAVELPTLRLRRFFRPTTH